MVELFQQLSEPYILRAMMVSSLVGMMCGLLGVFLVLRNMSLIGDALSHSILPGVFVAFVIAGAYNSLAFFIGTSVAGIITAVAITWLQNTVKTKNDAAIGIIFTAMFSLGVIGISWLNQQQGVHLDLRDFLFGDVLGINDEDIYLALFIFLFTFLSVILFYRYLFITTFQPTVAKTMGFPPTVFHYFLMLLLSFVVVASLRAVGVILVVAMLITPAATALLLSSRLRIVLVLSSFFGLLSAVLGIVVAVYFETPPGPAMCVVATMIYLLAVLFSPSKGIIVKYIRQKSESDRIVIEDIIKYLFKNGVSNTKSIGEFIGLSTQKVNQFIPKIYKLDYLSNQHSDKVQLNEAGKSKAIELVRAHRLWETYQVNALGLNEDQIHEDAEYMEHRLSKELLNEIDKKLGYPEKDPHGSPIPRDNTK